MTVLLAREVYHQLGAVALDFSVEERETSVRHYCQQEEIEEDKEKLLLRNSH